MEHSRYIDLKKLSLDELTGVINLYPWFGSARKELCVRMIRLGGGGWGEEQFADAALFIPYRRIVADMMRSVKGVDYSDKDIASVIKMCIREENLPENEVETVAEAPVEPVKVAEKRHVRVVGGDYFSQNEYDTVRKVEDGIFSKFAVKAKREMTPEELYAHEMDFCTETLARIYEEQGYYNHALQIYEKLILAYPEKSTYFASLIEKIKKTYNV